MATKLIQYVGKSINYCLILFTYVYSKRYELLFSYYNCEYSTLGFFEQYKTQQFLKTFSVLGPSFTSESDVCHQILRYKDDPRT